MYVTVAVAGDAGSLRTILRPSSVVFFKISSDVTVDSGNGTGKLIFGAASAAISIRTILHDDNGKDFGQSDLSLASSLTTVKKAGNVSMSLLTSMREDLEPAEEQHFPRLERVKIAHTADANCIEMELELERQSAERIFDLWYFFTQNELDKMFE